MAVSLTGAVRQQPVVRSRAKLGAMNHQSVRKAVV